MSDQEHHEVFESLGAYALGALSAGERTAVAAHLDSCPICADDADALERTASHLLEVTPQADPPLELRDRIMSVVEREAELMQLAAPGRNAPSRQRRRMTFAPPALRWAATAAAAAVIGGIVGVTAFEKENRGTDARTLNADVGRGHAWIEIDGDTSHLVVDGLKPPGKGRVYELWIQTGQDPPRPAHDDLDRSVFVMQSGRVEIPARLEPGDRIMVTAEPSGGSRRPTTAPVVITSRV